MKLVSREVRYEMDTSGVKPLQFTLGTLTVELDRNSTVLTMNVPLSRIYNYHLAATFFPTSCLLIIACLTLFIGPDHFEANVALALTTMLVMQTLHENISNGLPKTAYIKLVDWWLIYGIVVPFLVFLVLVVIEMLPNENKLDRTNRIFSARHEENTKVKTHQLTKERVHRWSKIGISSVSALFALAFMLYAVYIVNSDQHANNSNADF